MRTLFKEKKLENRKEGTMVYSASQNNNHGIDVEVKTNGYKWLFIYVPIDIIFPSLDDVCVIGMKKLKRFLKKKGYMVYMG